MICYDDIGDHVLLNCGHGGYCGACAKTLLDLRSKKRLCPICRASISAIAKVSLSTPVGGEAEVLESAVAKPPGESRRKRERERGDTRNIRGGGRPRRHRSGAHRGSSVRFEVLDLDASRRERRARRALRAQHVITAHRRGGAGGTSERARAAALAELQIVNELAASGVLERSFP